MNDDVTFAGEGTRLARMMEFEIIEAMEERDARVRDDADVNQLREQISPGGYLTRKAPVEE